MEYLITRAEPGNVIAHHGIKGQRWGQRRYQNKDGSLTPAGQKRYNKEVEKLKKETAKVKAEAKVLANRKKTQEKIDKLEQKKKALEEQKKALRDEKRGKKTDDKTDTKSKGKPEETLEEKRARLLKSSDPKELFEGRDALTNNELQDRLNRINLESQLKAKVPVEKKKTAMDYLNDSIAMYKKVDEAYSAVANSTIGKTLGKQLGLVEDKKGFDLDDFVKNIGKKDAKELKEGAEAVKNRQSIMDAYNKQKNKEKADADYAKQEAAEKARAEKAKANAQKQVDDYNKRWQKGESDDTVKDPSTTYRKSGDNIFDNKTASGRSSNTSRVGIEQIDKAPSDGKIYGKGTSTSSIKQEMDNGKNWFDTSNVSETVWFNDPVSSPNNRTAIESGQSYIALLEDKNR